MAIAFLAGGLTGSGEQPASGFEVGRGIDAPRHVIHDHDVDPHSAFKRPQLLEPLTSRERAVLLLLPTMMSNAEIADELFVSVNTVKAHLKSLYRKFGATSRRQAVVRARELGLLSSAGAPTTSQAP